MKKKHVIYLILFIVVVVIGVLLSFSLLSDDKPSRCQALYKEWDGIPKSGATKSSLMMILVEWKGEERKKTFIKSCSKLSKEKLEKEIKLASTAPKS